MSIIQMGALTALAIFMGASAGFALMRHGTKVPGYTLNVAPVIGLWTIEVLLIVASLGVFG